MRRSGCATAAALCPRSVIGGVVRAARVARGSRIRSVTGEAAPHAEGKRARIRSPRDLERADVRRRVPGPAAEVGPQHDLGGDAGIHEPALRSRPDVQVRLIGKAGRPALDVPLHGDPRDRCGDRRRAVPLEARVVLKLQVCARLPARGGERRPAIADRGVPHDVYAMDEPAPPVVVADDPAAHCTHDDVVPHDDRATADLDGAGGPAVHQVLLHGRGHAPVVAAVDLDAGPLGAADGVAGHRSPGIQLDLHRVADRGRHHAVEHVVLDPEVGLHARPVVAAKVQARRLQIGERAPEHGVSVAIDAVRGDRDPAHLGERAVLHGHPAPVLDLDRVDVGLGGTEREPAERDVAGEHVDDVVGCAVVDDPGRRARIRSRYDHRRAIGAAVVDGARACVVPRREAHGVSPSGGADRGAPVVVGGDRDGRGLREGREQQEQGHGFFSSRYPSALSICRVWLSCDAPTIVPPDCNACTS